MSKKQKADGRIISFFTLPAIFKIMSATSEIQQIEKLIHEGHFLQARSIAEYHLQQPDNLRVKQLYALSLSKSGAPVAAEEFLQAVYREYPDDPETSGILGGIYKELFKKSQDPRYALLARDTYLKNFSITKNYYTGINAAAMAVMAGHASKGKEIAQEIITIINPDTQEFWERVTLAEAYLLTKNSKRATELYLEARKLIHTDWGRVSSVNNQLWLLNHYLSVPGAVKNAYQAPGIAAFAGHMIDRHDRSYPRFPYYLEKQVKDALLAAIRTLNIKIGYTSIACGSDILFCESLIEMGGELNILLAFDKEEFKETSIRYAGDGWEDRFNKLIENYPVTYLTHEKYEGTDELFSFQSRMILGSALHRASLLQTKAHLLSVLSETDMTRKPGGTRDTLALWPNRGDHWTNINPDQFNSAQQHPPLPFIPTRQFEKTPHREIRYLIMVRQNDIEEVKTLAESFVSNMIEPAGTVWNLANDSFTIAFKVLRDAFAFISAISAALKSKNLLQNTRIVIHVGPVLIKEGDSNPIHGDQLAIVDHLSSIAVEGNLYATTSFVMSALLMPGNYTFEYAGRVDIQKFSVRQDLFRIHVNDH